MEELVTLTSNGITMTVPAKEVSLYARAGYKVVEAEKAPVGADEPEQPEPEQPEPEQPTRKRGK
jgi:hypothetical protein